jgi:hypothetical protein
MEAGDAQHRPSPPQVLDLFSGSGKNYDLIFMKSYFNLRLFLIYLFTVSNFIIYFVFGD